MEFAMRRPCLGFMACLAASPAPYAQNCGAAPPGGPPLLHLSETATIAVQPDLLVADLLASSQSPSAITTQRRVNDLMAKANLLAGKVAGVTVVFEDYSTDFVEQTNGVPAHWEAAQTLEIRGQSGDAILGLVGQLQALGCKTACKSFQILGVNSVQ